MKKKLLLIIAVISGISVYSQNLILNGSFEINTATSNSLNLTSTWASTVSDCFEVDGGAMDLITSNSCGVASDGNWYITCSPQGGNWPYLAFSFKLSTTLTQGAQYTLTLDKRFCGPNSSPIDIGLSNDSTLMGTAVHTFSAPTVNTWTSESYVFQAMLAAKYLTVNVGINGSTGTVGLDKFSLQAGAVGINEFTNKHFNIYPNPSNGSFNISFPNLNNENTIEILNVLGERVYTNKSMQSLSEINLVDSPAGIYFAKIHVGENIYLEKIEIQ